MNGNRAAALAICALALAGCGDGREKVVPISGRVVIDGQPVEHGYIRFYPANYRPASGKLGPGGKFELSTHEAGDGCVLGKHPVTVNAFEVINSSSQRWHAPKKYRAIETSDLVVEVAEPTDSVEIKLTWAGEKPFVETVKNAGD